MDTGIVKKMIINPYTGKRMKEIVLWYEETDTFEKFRWNSVYHVYNSVIDYSQLYQSQLKDIHWE